MQTQASPSSNFSDLDSLLLPAAPSPLFDLDDLLADSMKQKSDAENAKAARALLAKGGVNAETRKRMEAEIAAHEMKVLWTAQAAVAMFHRQWCDKCDLVHVHFAGFFQRQAHKTSKIQRWIASNEQQMGSLPKETKYEDIIVATCEECAALAGFPIDDYSLPEDLEAE